MAKITIRTLNDLYQSKVVKVPFTAVLNILFKIHLATLVLFCAYVLLAALFSAVLSLFGFGGGHEALNGLYF